MRDIQYFIDKYEKNQKSFLNLVASENILSQRARMCLGADLNHRYCIPPFGDRPKEIWEYPNQYYLRKIEKQVIEYAMQIYSGKWADVRPLSGNNVAYIILKSLVPPGGIVMSVPGDCGGHFSTKVICDSEKYKWVGLPYDRTKGVIDVRKLERIASKINPNLIFLDASMQLFPYPLKEIRNIFGERVVLSYDASHTFGIIGGGKFQSPLTEGADIIHGSTHKSLFGPQKGMIICKENGIISQKIKDIITPLFVSNMHMHHVATLGIALEEMIKYGELYANQVVANSKALAKRLYDKGFDLDYSNKGFTENHQIIVNIGDYDKTYVIFEKLEKVGINVNGIKIPFRDKDKYGLRLGTSELTRRGMKEKEMLFIGDLFYSIIFSDKSLNIIKKEVKDFSFLFKDIHFSEI